jgi:hypothetical protein
MHRLAVLPVFYIQFRLICGGRHNPDRFARNHFLAERRIDTPARRRRSSR